MTASQETLVKALIAAHDGGPLVGPVDAADVPADMTAVYEMQNLIIAGIGPVGGWKIVAGGQGEPLCSPIPANRFFANGAVLDAKTHRHFIAEVEVAVLLGADLFGKPNKFEVEAAIASVNPVLEMVANPFTDRDATPRNLQLGDLQSNGAVVVGPAVSNDIRADLPTLAVSLVYDGTLAKDVATGASWDDIVAALVWLAPHAEARGFPLKAGQTIITGARVAAPLGTADLVEGKLGDWGKVSARCTY
ncbi:fumarylacetoacetate hydrolase family protein [Devosia sp.]|uniref:fumarylacetoacetate hydrolase family protein n=1 Tax=Devosia sp. TaxID=1871048 RepID=UPI0025D4CDFD|nr:fumarylacetoacetate hydrolase family protein [Devosia sp.]MCR6635889.1 fumarylacetoacetate hydrolase family protein [Devosia sp.]